MQRLGEIFCTMLFVSFVVAVMFSFSIAFGGAINLDKKAWSCTWSELQGEVHKKKEVCVQYTVKKEIK